MGEFPLVVAGIVVGLIILGLFVFVVLRRRKERNVRVTNYRDFFVLGVTFLPLGIIYEIVFFVSGNPVFLILGLAFISLGLLYLVIGLNNRDKWKKS